MKKYFKEELSLTTTFLIMLATVFILLAVIVRFLELDADAAEKDTYMNTPSVETVEVADIVEPEPVLMDCIDEPMFVVEEEPTTYFDVPLDEDLQRHIFEVCESYGIDPAIVIAMIERESWYISDVIGDNGNSFGLMQIQPKWHQGRMDDLGVTDLLDPYQNVTVGVDILAELCERGNGIEWALMAYNGGPSYAYKKIAAGETSEYAAMVLGRSAELSALV